MEPDLLKIETRDAKNRSAKNQMSINISLGTSAEFKQQGMKNGSAKNNNAIFSSLGWISILVSPWTKIGIKIQIST